MDQNSPIFALFDAAIEAFHEGAFEGMEFEPQTSNTLIDTSQAVNSLVASQGNVGQAAKKLAIRRMRLRDWIDLNPEVQSCLEDIKAGKLDDVEDKQFEAAMSGDSASGRFLLQTLGKERGYVNRTENTGKDGQPLNPPSVDFSKMSMDTLRELRGAKESQE